MAAGLPDPSGGSVTIGGHPAGSIEARALVSYLPDTPALYDDLSLGEHLEYVARLHGVEEWPIGAPTSCTGSDWHLGATTHPAASAEGCARRPRSPSRSVVLATHRLEVVEQADGCLAIEDGRLVYDGPADSAEVARLLSA